MIRADTYRYSLLGALGYILMYWMTSFGMPGFLHVFGFVFCTFGAAAIAVGHTMHRLDMTE